MSKRLRLCDSSTHDKCPGCTFDSLKIQSYSYAALKSLQSSEANLPPDEGTVSCLQRTFERASVTLNDLIFANKRVLKRMEDAKAVVDATIENIALVLRPLPFLPDDILVAIFHWCIQGLIYGFIPSAYPHLHIIDSLCTTLPPWTLSHVCRHWRALVLTSPLLWSNISIPFALYTLEPHRRDSSRLTLYLQRSGTTKLNVTLQGRGDEAGWDSSAPARPFNYKEAFMQLLSSTIARWSRLDVDVDYTYFETLSSCAFPSLSYFNFYFIGDDEPALPFRKYRDMPQLTQLTIRYYGFVDLPWKDIRILTSCTLMLTQLSKMSKLEVLHVDDTFIDHLYHYYAGLQDQTEVYALPMLHTISILSGTDIHGILSQITAPALRTLELRFHITKAPPTIYPKCDKLRNLSNLSIEITPHDDDAIIGLLSRTTSITALSLGPDNASSAVLEAIGSRLLPKLTFFRLHLSTVRAQPDKVISMMESRRDSIYLAALEEVTFMRSGRYEGRMLETVEALQGLGLYRWEGDKIFQRWVALRDKLIVRYDTL